MGGRIWVESAAGRGSTFRFTVRLRMPEQLDAEPGLPVFTPEAAGGLPVCGIPPQAGPISAPAPATLSAAPPRLLRVLLAEDTPANQKLVSYVLGKRGHSVEVVQNGAQALEAVGRQDFNVVLMDVQMPVMDGFQATQTIRQSAHPKKARLPIIALTAHALKGDAERCLEAGMNGYLSKPVKGDELIELVERLAGLAAG